MTENLTKNQLIKKINDDINDILIEDRVYICIFFMKKYGIYYQ